MGARMDPSPDIPSGPLTLIPLTEDDLASVYPWFDDPVTAERLGGREWPWGLLRFANRAPERRIALLATKGGTPVGLVDIELVDEARAYVALVVAPELRRRGIARAIAARLETLPYLQDRVIEAQIHADHAASRTLAAAHSFTEAGVEGDGFVRYVREP